jgi:transcriptional regulator with XRE-family HTH domain
MSIGERIRRARKAAGLLQADLAAVCGVRELAISHWEKGRTVPRADAAAKIADRCGVDAGWLVTGAGEGPALDDDEPQAAA